MKMFMKAGRMLKCLGPTGKKLIRFSPNDKLMMVHEQAARRIYIKERIGGIGSMAQYNSIRLSSYLPANLLSSKYICH